MQCDTPTYFSNSAESFTDETIDGQVTYTCHSDKYYPDGNTTRISICQHDPVTNTVSWAPSLLDCTCKECVQIWLEVNISMRKLLKCTQHVNNVAFSSPWTCYIILYGTGCSSSNARILFNIYSPKGAKVYPASRRRSNTRVGLKGQLAPHCVP